MSNPFDDAISSKISQSEKNANIASVVSDMAKGVNPKSKNGVLKEDGTIAQTEKLFTARARYASKDNRFENSTRGPAAYIKLLTSQVQYREYLTGTTKRDLVYKDLVGSGGDLTTMADYKDGSNTSNNFGYDKFLLTGVSASFSEKIQITEVFGDGEVVYYFGRQPMMFNLSGMLIDSPDNDWFSDWVKLYSDVLRGTQLAKNYELVKIVLPNMSITGTIVSFSWQQNANRDVDIPFTLQFLAKLVEPTPAVKTGLPTNNLVSGIDFSSASTTLNQAEINSLKGQVSSLSSIIKNPLSTLQQKGAALQKIGTGVGGSFGTSLENSKNGINSFRSTVDSWTQGENNFFNGIQQNVAFQSVTSSLNGIRTNLFSPVYGVLTSLTKLVSSTLGNATSIFNSVTIPVRNILRDITNISNETINLVNTVNSSITSFGRYTTGQIRGVEKDYKTAIQSLSKAAGVVATAPVTASQSISHMFQMGAISVQSPFLISVTKASFARPSSTTPVSKAALLRSIPVYSPAKSNRL